MRISSLAAIMILATFLLSGCQQQQMAALDDHGTQFFGRTGIGFSPGMTAGVTSAAAVDTVSSSELPPPSVRNTGSPVAMSQWQWPVDGQVIQRFDKQSEGITIAARQNAPIHAAAAGEVAYIGHGMKDYGNLVILRHANGEMSSYAHAAQITVSKGAQVKQGDVLGYVGMSGNAKTPELHFAIRSGDHSVDPLGRLPQRVASN